MLKITATKCDITAFWSKILQTNYKSGGEMNEKFAISPPKRKESVAKTRNYVGAKDERPKQ